MRRLWKLKTRVEKYLMGRVEQINERGRKPTTNTNHFKEEGSKRNYSISVLLIIFNLLSYLNKNSDTICNFFFRQISQFFINKPFTHLTFFRQLFSVSCLIERFRVLVSDSTYLILLQFFCHWKNSIIAFVYNLN